MTVVSDPFVYGALVLLKSLLRHSPRFDGDLVIVSNADFAPLSEDARTILAACGRPLIFHEAPSGLYEPFFAFADTIDKTPARLRAAYFILEAFRLESYDCIVSLDSDMLVLGDLSRLFLIDAPFAVARAVDWTSGQPLPYFNTGTMVVRHDRADAISFEQLARALNVEQVDPRHGNGDQAVLNVALRGYRRFILDERYNFSKRRVPADRDATDFLRQEDVRVLHFLGQKPWNLKTRWSETTFSSLEQLWTDAFMEGASPDLVGRYLQGLTEQAALMLDFIAPREQAPDSRRRENALTRSFEDKLYARGSSIRTATDQVAA